MKTRIVITALLLLFLSTLLGSCKKQCTEKFERKLALNNFSRVEAGGNFMVTIVKGDSFNITVSGCEDDVLDTKATIVAGKLDVRFNTPTRQHGVVGIYITMLSIAGFDISGTSNIRLLNFGDQQQLSGRVSGVSKATLDVTADSLLLDVSGQSNVELTGTAIYVRADVTGQSNLSTYGLSDNEKTSVVVSGQSLAKVFCKNELIADVSGQSTLRYKGNPSIKQITSTGQSKVIQE